MPGKRRRHQECTVISKRQVSNILMVLITHQKWFCFNMDWRDFLAVSQLCKFVAKNLKRWCHVEKFYKKIEESPGQYKWLYCDPKKFVQDFFIFGQHSMTSLKSLVHEEYCKLESMSIDLFECSSFQDFLPWHSTTLVLNIYDKPNKKAVPFELPENLATIHIFCYGLTWKSIPQDYWTKLFLKTKIRIIHITTIQGKIVQDIVFKSRGFIRTLNVQNINCGGFIDTLVNPFAQWFSFEVSPVQNDILLNEDELDDYFKTLFPNHSVLSDPQLSWRENKLYYHN